MEIELKTAWYVDDDSEMIQAIRLMLKLLGYETQSFFDAREAAKLLMGGQKPDILILDINMPKVTGIDMLEFIRRSPDWNDVPIVMLSSEVTDVQVDEAIDLGADGYIFKPVMIDELEKVINTAVEKRNISSE
jgi:two-component system chemotaxis response regulator CheY